VQRMTSRFFLALFLASVALPLAAQEAAVPDFAKNVKPVLERHCYSCHNAKQTKGDVDLASFATEAALASDTGRLQMLLEVVSEGFMPPKSAKPVLAPNDRRVLSHWLEDQLLRKAKSQAGDPGKVVLRRLTNAELNYTLADLTGLVRDWTKDFPRDGSGGEGFANTGQTLQMSAALVEKYLALSQRIADLALAFPGSGPTFADSPVPEAEWSRLAVERLDAFCSKNGLVYQDMTPSEQLMSYAYPDGKSPKLDFGPKGLRGYKKYSNARPGDPLQFLLTSHRLFYRSERLCPSPLTFPIPQGKVTKKAGEMTLAETREWENLWLDLRHATGYARPFKISLLHRWFSFQPYQLGDNPAFEENIKNWKGKKKLDPEKDLSFTVMSLAGFLDELRPISAAELKEYANIQNSGDGESMGTMVPNHDAFDAFIHLSLNDAQIEKLWKMTCDPNSPLAKRLKKAPPQEMQDEWAQWSERQGEWQKQARQAFNESLCTFVSRAWRRPLTPQETAGFHASLDKAVKQGRSLTSAVQEMLVYALVSPHFLYRIEKGQDVKDEAKGVRPLTNIELANRLSYFLWSSMPDAELTEAAAQGKLTEPAELVRQTKRMTQDKRIRRFATEMFGQWLGFHGFENYTRPNAERFPEFDADLRKAMFGEAVEFCTDLVANDRDVRMALQADYAFLPTRRLAEHYGIGDLGEPRKDAWSTFKPSDTSVVGSPRISLSKTSRRGVLGWGAMLTATSHPLRTSPVLRGNWILSELLGIPTPPPPNVVPELPQDEKNEQKLTVAQLLARHRQDAACAACHNRIDPLGLALENFDPIGRYRTRDLNDSPIDASTKWHDGQELQGLPGLVIFVTQEKQQTLFTRRLSRKVLGYALGRTVQPGDTMLLNTIQERLSTNDGRFSTILEAVVTSPQFRTLRHETAKTGAPQEKK
jgi:hypothetical protein